MVSASLQATSGLYLEVASGGRGLSVEELLYFWSITRGGLWWEGSLNGGTTVLLVYN